MTTTQEKFDQAVQYIQNTPASSPLSQDIQLKMYGLFKQATFGDVQEKAPSRIHVIKRAKHNAWSANKGMSQEEAQLEYIREFEAITHKVK